MRTHNVEPGDWVQFENGDGFQHCGESTIRAFRQRQPMPLPPTTVVQPLSYADKTEQLQVRPGDVVCVVAPGLTVFVKGVEPAQITVPERKNPSSYTATRLCSVWTIVDEADNLKADMRRGWPRLTDLLDELSETFGPNPGQKVT